MSDPTAGTVEVRIPRPLDARRVMRVLRSGHGYHWTVLRSSPGTIAHGISRVRGMPEVLIIGTDLVVSGGDRGAADRLSRMLHVIAAQGVTR